MFGRKIYGLILMMVCLLALDASAQMKYSTKSKKAIKHFEEALKYYNSRRGGEAIDILKKAIKADENFAEA